VRNYTDISSEVKQEILFLIAYFPDARPGSRLLRARPKIVARQRQRHPPYPTVKKMNKRTVELSKEERIILIAGE
jgi:hypothetical protein